MKCDEVQKKLPEYLAGVLDEKTGASIAGHIKTCSSCSSELEELNQAVIPESRQGIDVNEKKIIRKTKTKFRRAIIATVAVFMGVLLLFSLIPTVLWGFQSVTGQSRASRALMDFVQFSQPNKVNMWGNSAVEGLALSVPLKIGARSVIGENLGPQLEFVGKMSVVNGKVTVPSFIGAGFVHPDQFIEKDFGYERNMDAQLERLRKNADNTVSTVDYSLNKVINLSDVGAIMDQYDIEVCWMAVEAGIEDLKPRNMTFDSQQVLQWGIPAKLSRPGEFDYAQLESGNIDAYEKAALEELKWLDANKNILKPDAGLLKNNGIDNSVKGQAQYIIKNGFKIYGLRVTGPSSELIKLTEALDIRTMSVVAMDFWNW